MLLVEAINQRISRNIASKFRRQHAAQFNFCRYEGLCPATKTEIHRVFPVEFCEILEQLLSRIILGGCYRKENR